MASFFLASNIYIKFFLPKDQYLITAATSDSPVVYAFGFAFSGFLVGFGTTVRILQYIIEGERAKAISYV